MTSGELYVKLSLTRADLVHAQGFRDFLRQLRTQGIRVLVTSRCQLGGGLHRAEHLYLTSLSSGHAADLLRQEAGADRATPLQARSWH